MNSISDLINFLTEKMSMSEVYQPLIISELIRAGGKIGKKDLAIKLASYDKSIQEYYEKILMRWPKITLEKHGIIKYTKENSMFELGFEINDSNEARKAVEICSKKIEEWLELRNKSKDPEVNASRRYEVLKASGGKCDLCGISSKLRPLDVDHIIPRSKANKYGKVVKNGKIIDLHSLENLQALCFKCNRAKRDTDDTDFRKRDKLVRDCIIQEIERSGRKPNFKVLKQKEFENALEEKLIEEVAEYLDSKNPEELADILEVIFAIAEAKKVSEKTLIDIQKDKKLKKGGFTKRHFLMGDL